MTKTLITISGDDVSPRFDMTSELLIANIVNGILREEPKTILLGKTSSEDLCSFIIMENISCVVCGAIEEKHYKYLLWKKVEVIDSIIGPHQEAILQLTKNNLIAGAILPGSKKR